MPGLVSHHTNTDHNTMQSWFDNVKMGRLVVFMYLRVFVVL
jgi:hypothetical protein